MHSSMWMVAPAPQIGGRSSVVASFTWVRERSLATLTPPNVDTSSDPDDDTCATSSVDNDDDDATSPVDNDDDDAGNPLRPDLYCLDHDRRVVVHIEFTVADDANLGAAVGRKHAKYDPWLLRNPCASIAHLVPGARDPHSWTFDPLVVVAVGVWGTVPTRPSKHSRHLASEWQRLTPRLVLRSNPSHTTTCSSAVCGTRHRRAGVARGA